MVKSRSQVVVVRNAKQPKLIRIANKKRNTGRRRQTRGLLKGAFGNCTVEYIKSIIDPFENVGPRLGWGTMIPTTVTQIYLRGFQNADANGNVQLILMPSAKGMLIEWGGATNAYANGTSVDAINATSMNATFEAARIISLGLKSWPNLALTAAPGVLWSGAAILKYAEIQASLVSADFQAFPTTLVTRGVDGGTTTGRPIDPSSFEFQEYIVDTVGWTGIPGTAEATLPFSTPYHVYTGIGNGTTVYYEAVINVEGTVALHHGSTPAISGQSGDTSELLATEHGTIERMWNFVKEYLPYPSTPGINSVGVMAKEIANTAYTSLLSYAGKAIGNAIGGPVGGYAGALIGNTVGTLKKMREINNLMPYQSDGVRLLK